MRIRRSGLPAGDLVCSAIGFTAAEVECLLGGTGSYTILAGDETGDNNGSYNLFLERLNNPGNPTFIDFGDTLPGSVVVAGMNAFSLSATVGDSFF